jgi:hypothetical protein
MLHKDYDRKGSIKKIAGRASHNLLSKRRVPTYNEVRYDKGKAIPVTRR